MNPLGMFILGVGLFALMCAIGNFDWFMENEKARFWTERFGRRGARVFYVLLGSGLALYGGMMTANVLQF